MPRDSKWAALQFHTRISLLGSTSTYPASNPSLIMQFNQFVVVPRGFACLTLLRKRRAVAG
jgi:hypothetical protein